MANVNLQGLAAQLKQFANKNLDKRNFASPFIDISIGKTPTNLTPIQGQLKRLLEKVEIQHSLDDCGFSQVTLTFIEGSREPFPFDSDAADNTLYEGLSNRPGMLADLKFANIKSSKNNYVTFTNKKEEFLKDLQTAQQLAETALSTIKGVKENVDIQKYTVKVSKDYVFDKGNWVRVDWGYRAFAGSENNILFASFLGKITIVQYDFPDNSSAAFTIIIQSSEAEDEQVINEATLKSNLISKKYVDKKGKFITELAPITLDQHLTDIADLLGAQLIKDIDGTGKASKNLASLLSAVSKETKAYTVKHRPKDMSDYVYLKHLADKTNCIFKSAYDVLTGKPIILFVHRSRIFNKEILPRYLFEYRGKDTLLKSLAIKADYGSLNGQQAVSIDDTGTKQKQRYQINMAAPADGNAVYGQNIAQATKNAPANLELDPGRNTAQTATRTQSYNNCAQNMVILEAEVIGHPHIRPGTIYISNIGKRYSGHYKIQNCVHSIDMTSGYTCKITAKTDTLANDSNATSEGSPSIKKADDAVKVIMTSASLPKDDTEQAITNFFLQNNSKKSNS